MSAATPLHPSLPTSTPGSHAALDRLAAALDDLPADGEALSRWRWAVRQHLVGVRDLLTADDGSGADGWLAARGTRAVRRRNALLGRLSLLGTQVLESPDVAAVAAVAAPLRRLVADVRHHRQRISDLVYDEVALELGGED
jgi:hypothetical protein